jgi:hypothetical protein
MEEACRQSPQVQSLNNKRRYADLWRRKYCYILVIVVHSDSQTHSLSFGFAFGGLDAREKQITSLIPSFHEELKIFRRIHTLFIMSSKTQTKWQTRFCPCLWKRSY